MNWQPIENAPQDGTWVLLAGGHEYGDEPVGPCVVGHWVADSYGDGYWAYAYWDSGWRSGYDEPTHWMPLPEPPK